MASDNTRAMLAARLGWLALAEKQGLIAPTAQPKPAAPRTAAEAIYPHLPSATRTPKEPPR
jgi:hypothetical protein